MVNALVHRDYRSRANVQVHIYRNRVEIISPGGLPAGMKEEYLGFKSIPRNPLLFGLFYRMDMVEQVGSGIRRIRQICHDYGVDKPDLFVEDNCVTVVFKRDTVKSGIESGEVTGEVLRLLRVINGEMKRRELQDVLALKHEDYFREAYLLPALESGYIEMTIPDKPRSSEISFDGERKDHSSRSITVHGSGFEGQGTRFMVYGVR